MTYSVRGDDVLNEMIVAAGSALGAGGIGGGVIGAIVGRRSRRVDALDRLEQIATRIAERSTQDADRRVAAVEQRLAEHERRDRDRVAAQQVTSARHMQWDLEVAEQVRALGGTVTAPPPIEVV